MQKWVSNISVLLLALLMLHRVATAQSELNLLNHADSLYNSKKYSEAQQIYFELFQKGYSSPSTLLKMAFVHEGLGQIPQALFFLWSYYSQTEDSKAFEKIQVLSNAHNLKGYELTDWDRIMIWIGNREALVIPILTIAILVCVIFMMFLKWKALNNLRVVVGVLSTVILIVFIFITNFVDHPQKGVVTRLTYMMDGPSAGANLLTMISEGNQLSISGEHDVWVRVKWNSKDGYIRKNDVLLY